MDVRPTVDNTIGALFLGTVFAALLTGITVLQAFLYFHHFRRDLFVHKISVAVLLTLDSLHGAFTIHAVYTYIVTRFGMKDGLDQILWSVKVQVSLNVVIILLVQSLYTFRVWLLSGYYRGLLGYLVVAAVIGGFGIGVALAYELWTVNTFPELDTISWAINSSLAAATVIDFTIASAMCYYLWKSKSPTSRLNTRISTLIQYTLGSGVFTSACSTTALLTYIFMPNNLIFMGVQFLLTKLYLMSFITMLNSRPRGGSGATTVEEGGTVTVDFPLQSYHATRQQQSIIATPPRSHIRTKSDHGDDQRAYAAWPSSDRDSTLGSPLSSSPLTPTNKETPVYAQAW